MKKKVKKYLSRIIVIALLLTSMPFETVLGADLESGNSVSSDMISPVENEEVNDVIEESKEKSEEIVNSAESDNIRDISTLEENKDNNNIIEESKEKSEKIDNSVEFDNNNNISDAISEEELNTDNSFQTRSSITNPLSFEQSYTCNIGDTISIDAVFTSKELAKKRTMTCNNSSAVSIGYVSSTPLSASSYGLSAPVTPNKAGIYTITLSITTDKNVYTASTKLTVIDPFKEEFFTGILKSVDTSTRKLSIDDLTYDVTNECDLSSALNVMKNSDSKKVVYSTTGGKVNKICSIYDVLTPNISISASPDSILYQNGSYSASSINVKIHIRCQSSATSPFSAYSLTRIDGLSLTLQEFELKSKSNLLNFGETDSFFRKDIMSESKKGIEVGYLDVYEDSFTVYTNTYKAPNKVSTQVELSSKVKLDGKKSDVISNSVYITVGNLDKQQEEAKKKNTSSKYGQYINEASGTLKGISNAIQFSNGYLSNVQEKAINQFVNVWMSELILAKYIDKSDFKSKISKKVSDKLLSKLGVDKNIVTNANTITATTYLSTRISDKTDVFIQFDINLLCMSFGKDGFPTMASGSGKATVYDTKGKELDSSVILPAYANVCAFTKQLQEVIKSTVFNGTKTAEKIFIGDGDEKIAEALSSKTMGRILNAGYEKKIFDMTTSKDLKKAFDELFKKGLKTCNDKILKLTIDSSFNYLEKVSIQCPVDVNIYDSDGNLCGVVADNTVDSTYDDVIVNVNNGDQKNIYFTEDEYSFELIGTDEGSMNYEVSEMDNTGNIVRKITYENVKLSKGCKYYSYVPEAGNYSSTLFDLVDDNGNIFSPTTGADENNPDIPDTSIARGQCGNQAYWKLFDDGLLYIYGNGKMYNYRDNLGYLAPWAYIQTDVKKISIDKGLTSIGNCAFDKYRNLSEIILPESLTSIGFRAFTSCESLREITLPEGLTSIGDEAFAGCKSLSGDITLPEGLTSIGDSAFYGCDSLSKITLPASLTSLGNSAFKRCDSLSKITLPASLTSLGNSAFYECKSLREITLPESLTSIGFRAFTSCESLREITLPEGLTSIGDEAFAGCKSLSGDITLPEGLTSIGNSTFYGCDSLSKITLPASLTSLGNSAFYKCKSLREITLPESLTSIGTIGNSAFYACESLSGDITLPEGLTSIGDSAFAWCKNLSKITLPASLTSIGRDAFSKCESLSGDITLPEGLTSIGDRTFYECKSLREITLPEGLTSIGYGAFAWCKSLSGDITLPEGLTSIGDSAFIGCENLSKITLPTSLASIGNSAFKECKSLSGEITLPEGLTSIGNSTFIGCENLSKITLPTSLASIGNSTFCNCKSLREITLPEGLTSIGDRAFFLCDSLKEITLPEGLASIGEAAFAKCKSLSKITLLAALTSISNEAFSGCESLSGKIILPEGLTSIGYSAFAGCKSLREIELPKSLTSIGRNAFYECENLSGEITLPEGLTSIGSSAFMNCESLREINLPTGLTSIAVLAFYGCSSLSKIILPTGLTSIADSAFSGCESLSGEITLPEGLASIGRNAFNGCSLSKITILSNSCEIPDDYYVFSGPTTIYGYSGSTAEQYAKKYGKKFVAIASPQKKKAQPWNIKCPGILYTGNGGCNIKVSSAEGTVTFKSENPKVVKVGKIVRPSVNSASCTLTPVSSGQATIIVKAAGNKNYKEGIRRIKITVKKPILKLQKTSAKIKRGKTVRISVKAIPSNKITYTSGNKKIATVNSKGTVKGKKKGTAKITVKCNGIKKIFKVTVK